MTTSTISAEEISTATHVAKNICKQWSLSPDATKSLLQLDEDNSQTAERVSYVLRIHRGLRTLFSDPNSIYGWVTKKNDAPGFDGDSALEKMLHDRDGLAFVANYVDSLIS